MAHDPVGNIFEALNSFETALLITHTNELQFRARPMLIARVDPDCSVWFFTGRDTAKVHQIENDKLVLIACQSAQRYLALSGNAQLITDDLKARDLWKDPLKTWFPKGVEDPELLLIRVRPTTAEYWNNSNLAVLHHQFEPTP